MKKLFYLHRQPYFRRRVSSNKRISSRNFSERIQYGRQITFEAGDNEITPPVDPENPDPTDPVDPIDPPGPGTVVPYQLIMGQNLNLVHKRFLRQIKRIMLRQMK